MLKAIAEKITLKFKQAAGTSRGVLHSKNSWIIKIWDDTDNTIIGIGEASIIENLSPDWSNSYENKLHEILASIHHINPSDIKKYPSIRFGIEAALLDLKNGGNQHYFSTNFTDNNEGIRINGLIWMGKKDFMLQQIQAKLDAGYKCLKLKIGAIDFEEELSLIKYIRSKFSEEILELRLDANGAFDYHEAQDKLDLLGQYKIHSIEQPIKQRQWTQMADLCANSPFPVALDEELIGINDKSIQKDVIKLIKPQFVILKPSFLGGFEATDNWIHLAEEHNVGWWITSALEANVGLNALAQYTATKNNPLPQGLGTGQLFENNSPSSMRLDGEFLYFS
jgi:o-succinylbenzoate synthase